MKLRAASSCAIGAGQSLTGPDNDDEDESEPDMNTLCLSNMFVLGQRLTLRCSVRPFVENRVRGGRANIAGLGFSSGTGLSTYATRVSRRSGCG